MFNNLLVLYSDSVVEPFVVLRSMRQDRSTGANRDLQSAVAVATNVFHFREHLPREISMTRGVAERLCPEYGILGDVVNATKHGKATKETPHGMPLVSTAGQVAERVFVLRYHDAQGEYTHVEKAVVVTMNDSKLVDLLAVLTAVVNFWEQVLFDSGLLAKRRVFVCEKVFQWRDRASCSDTQLDISVRQGNQLQLDIQMVDMGSSKP